MSVEFYLARRYLLDKREGAIGWLISFIATGSVALGVAALIVTLAIMTGFREDIQLKMLGINPHIYVESFSRKIDPVGSQIDDKLKKSTLVEAWAPYVRGQILIGRGRQSSGATLKGIDPKKEAQIVGIDQKISPGNWFDLGKRKSPAEKPGIILGQELARNIGARMGDVVWVITPSSLEITALSVPKAHLFKVIGIIKTGLYDYDSAFAFTHLKAAQSLFGLGKFVTGYGLKVENPDKAEEIGRRLQSEHLGSYWVRSWLSLNKNLFSALKLERTVMFLILAMLTVVAAFMIVSNLLLIISHKVKEIGILRAMGASSAIIRRTFLLQGMIIGLVGNGIGVLLGLGVSQLLAKTNIIKLPSDVYYIDHLPIRLVPLDIVFVVLLAVVIVLCAILYPSYKAAKLDPIEAIRYG